jgi:hypothetical protein
MTTRLVRAMESGVVDCIGHPLNRLLGQREPVRLDLEQVLKAARRLGVSLELNADPVRLDLDAASCRQAKEWGVPLVICSNAHHPSEVARLQYGVYTARRGWLEAKDVLNTASSPVQILERRQERRRATIVQVPREPEKAEEIGPLLSDLQSSPLPEKTSERLDSWLRGAEDPTLVTALEYISDNPTQKAFELLWTNQRRPRPVGEDAKTLEPKQGQ